MEFLSLQFLWALFAIILIDVVLGGENAIVISLASRQLPEDLRKRAILWGTFGAVLVRFLCVALLTYLLMIPGLRLIGGLLLIFIAWKLTTNSDNQKHIKSSVTFWGAMGTIVIADAVMGLDNALAIAAAANGNWLLIILGLLISVPIILYGSNLIGKFIDKYPDSVYIGSFVLYIVALKMISNEPLIDLYLDPLEDLYEISLPILGAIILTAKQYYRTKILHK